MTMLTTLCQGANTQEVPRASLSDPVTIVTGDAVYLLLGKPVARNIGEGSNSVIVDLIQTSDPINDVWSGLHKIVNYADGSFEWFMDTIRGWTLVTKGANEADFRDWYAIFITEYRNGRSK
jgi:hypothetical protein